MAMEYVHIWLGKFSSPKAFENYLEESYDEDGEEPINQFAADQGETFYDHDWLESSFNETATIEQLLVSHSYSSTYSQEALEKANHLGVKTANTFIMADSKEFKTPQSKQGADYSLHYLGQFKLLSSQNWALQGDANSSIHELKNWVQIAIALIFSLLPQIVAVSKEIYS